MRNVFVNKIEEEDNITHGYAVLNATVLKNLPIILQEPKLTTAVNEAKASPIGINFFLHYGQLVVLVQINITGQNIEGSMNFMDIGNNMDAALDHLSKYMKNGWSELNKRKFMESFQKVQDSKDSVEMIIENEIHP